MITAIKSNVSLYVIPYYNSKIDYVLLTYLKHGIQMVNKKHGHTNVHAMQFQQTKPNIYGMGRW